MYWVNIIRRRSSTIVFGDDGELTSVMVISLLSTARYMRSAGQELLLW